MEDTVPRYEPDDDHDTSSEVEGGESPPAASPLPEQTSTEETNSVDHSTQPVVTATDPPSSLTGSAPQPAPESLTADEPAAPNGEEALDSVSEDKALDAVITEPEPTPLVSKPDEPTISQTEDPLPVPVNDNADESEGSDYDPYDIPGLETSEKPTTSSTVETNQLTTTSASSQPAETSVSDDEEYDPTADVVTNPEPIQQSQSPAIPQQTPLYAPATAAPVAAPAPAVVDQAVIQALTMRLLTDPTFLQLSDTEKQQRIAGEYLQLQAKATRDASSGYGSMDHSSNKIMSQQSEYRHSSRKTYVPDPRAPQRPDLNEPMSPEETAEFKKFLREEPKYHSKYPHTVNSRVFVGNVPTNHIGKEGLWRIFKVYGRPLQVSLKTAYGFIQYETPEAAAAAIAGESHVPLYEKVMSLEIAKCARPDEMSAKNRNNYRDRNDGRSRDRERDDPRPKDSQRRRKLDVQIIIQPSAEANYGRDVAREFENRGFATEYMFQRPGQELSELVTDAAYSGVISVVLVTRHNSLDVQIYEKSADGGVRFDEYVSLNVHDAAGLIATAKARQPPVSGFNSDSFGSHNSGYGDRNSGRERGGRNGGNGQRNGHRNDRRPRSSRKDERDHGYRDVYQNDRGYNNSNQYHQAPQPGLPEALQNMTPEQFRELGARLGYQVQAPQPPVQQQVPQSAINQLLAGQSGQSSQPQSNVQSLLDSLTKMR